MILFIISFIAGVLTVLAPCVLPLLPVIVGGSLAGEEVSRKRAVTVTIALGVSVILFTLVLKVSTIFVMIPESLWQWISGGIVLLFGIVTLFPEIWEHVSFTKKINQSSNQVLATGFKKKSFWGDVIVGAALGPVFSSCSPTYFLVLATVLPQRPVVGFVYLLAYTVGMCLMLLFVALIGQRVINKLGIAADPKGWFKRILGILFIVVGLLIISGIEKKLELKLASSGYFDVTQIEQKLLQIKQ